jgi:ATF/CREB family transcription factor
MNNGGHAGPASGGPTITPNTLNAITGVLNNPNNSNSNQYGHHQQSQGQQGHGQENDPSYLASANNAANTAANGLFLLSQAHQELTKREEAQARQNGAANGQQNANGQQQSQPVNGKRGTKRKVTQYDAEPANGTIDISPQNHKPKRASTRGGRGRKASMSAEDEEEEDSDDDMGDDHGSGGRGRGKKPETEEEKRKNFLERNRQGNFPFLP